MRENFLLGFLFDRKIPNYQMHIKSTHCLVLFIATTFIG